MSGIVDESVLRTWRTLEAAIMTLSEEACWTLLREETAGIRRRLFVQRIYGRASTLRAARETKELRALINE
jgi:hypothetical protein